jgi:hypothetical protein
MVYAPAPEPMTFTRVGAYTQRSTGAVVRLSVDGRLRASGRLHGRGWVAARIRPVHVPAGGVLRVSTRAGRGALGLLKLHADAEWIHVLRLGRSFRYHLRQDATNPVTVYPLGPWTSPGNDGCP